MCGLHSVLVSESSLPLVGGGSCSMAWHSPLSFPLSLRLSSSLSAGCRLLPRRCSVSCFLVALLKAVASRPCCCRHYVLTSDLTPGGRPTGKKFAGLFGSGSTHARKKEGEAKGGEKTKTKKGRKKEKKNGQIC